MSKTYAHQNFYTITKTKTKTKNWQGIEDKQGSKRSKLGDTQKGIEDKQESKRSKPSNTQNVLHHMW
jgi:hypothetical protein